MTLENLSFLADIEYTKKPYDVLFLDYLDSLGDVTKEEFTEMASKLKCKKVETNKEWDYEDMYRSNILDSLENRNQGLF